MSSSILPLKNIAELEVAKLLWNVSFSPEYLNGKEIKHDLERKWEIRLTDCREETLELFYSSIQGIEIPFYIKCNIIELICSIHEEYRQLFLWKITYDPLNKIDFLHEGELYAPNFFTICETFNDDLWAKRFVFNEHCNLTERFRIASSYWFSNECATLWRKLKNSYFDPLVNVCDIFSNFDESIGIISLMILHLDFPTTEPERDWRDEENFWKIVFEHAVEMGYKYAAVDTWKNIPETEKREIMRSNKIFELMHKNVEVFDGQICYFLYKTLSNNRKWDLHQWTIDNDKLEVWHCLLKFSYYEETHEIFDFYRDIPYDMFFHLSNLLVHRINQIYDISDLETLIMLWRKLTPTEKHNILESGDFINNLTKRYSYFYLCYFINSITLEQKNNILLHDFYGAGVTTLSILCEEREFSVLQVYLNNFFIEMNGNTSKQTLRVDAISFFELFKVSYAYEKWYEMGISEMYENEITNAVENLQSSLYLLDELCDKVSEEIYT